jgi:hypothetical protein
MLVVLASIALTTLVLLTGRYIPEASAASAYDNHRRISHTDYLTTALLCNCLAMYMHQTLPQQQLVHAGGSGIAAEAHSSPPSIKQQNLLASASSAAAVTSAAAKAVAALTQSSSSNTTANTTANTTNSSSTSGAAGASPKSNLTQHYQGIEIVAPRPIQASSVSTCTLLLLSIS